MTIQDFIDECTQVVNGLNITPSINADYVRGEMVDAIIEHFKNKGLEVRERTWTGTEFSFETKERITLSTGVEVELNMEFVFGTVVKNTGNIIPVSPTRSKYEKTVGDKPIKFKEMDIDYHIPSYEMKNKKVVLEKGWFSSENVQFLQKVKTTDDSKSIVGKIDIADIEHEFDSHLCQPVLKGIMFFKVPITGTDAFIDAASGNIDMKGLADFIRKNMM